MDDLPIDEEDGKLWGLPPEHLWLLGAIAAGSAMLEQDLGVTLRSQLGLDPPLANILVSGMSLNMMIDKVIAIARFQLAGTSVLRDLEQWAIRARAASKNRNAALHSVWFSNPPAGELFSASFAKVASESPFQARTWTEEELQELISELASLVSEFVTFWSRMGHIEGQPGETPSQA